MRAVITAFPLEAAAIPGDSTFRPADPGGAVEVRLRSQPTRAAVIVSGPGPDRAAAAVDRAAELGAESILVAGVAGGLAPRLMAGDLIVVHAVLDLAGGEALDPDAKETNRLCEILQRAAIEHCRGPVATSPVNLLSGLEKMELGSKSGTMAVDMETAPLFREASKRSLPVSGLRAVVDNALDDVPPEMGRWLDESGRVETSLLLASLLRKPSLITFLPGWGIRFAKARKALGRAVDAVLAAES